MRAMGNELVAHAEDLDPPRRGVQRHARQKQRRGLLLPERNRDAIREQELWRAARPLERVRPQDCVRDLFEFLGEVRVEDVDVHADQNPASQARAHLIETRPPGVNFGGCDLDVLPVRQDRRLAWGAAQA